VTVRREVEAVTTATSTPSLTATRWLVLYVALAMAFSWVWWVPMAATGTVSRAGQGWPTHLLGLTGPALAAIVVTAAADGRRGLSDLGRRAVRWRVGWRWWLLVLATLALSGIGFLAGGWGGDPVSLPDLGVYSGAPGARGLGLVLVAGYVLVVNGFGEELGWRGFMAHRLLPRLGRLRTASVVWLVWALWHAPLFLVVENFRDFGPGTTVGWLVGLWFGSYFLTWLYESAGFSVLIVAAWHTAYNVATATEATAGLAAAVTSTLVIVASLLLLLRPRSPVRRGGARRRPRP
jgi:membrane protease YdiL (CAAX protease family)